MIDFIQQFGVLVVVLIVVVNQIGLPMPALPALMLAGALIPPDDGSLILLSAGAIVVCVVTDLGWYFAGRRYGTRAMNFLCSISLNPVICASRAQHHFERWSVGILVLGKFVPGLSTLAPPLAGAAHMNRHRFFLSSALAACLWVGAGVGGGIILGPQIEALLPVMQRYVAIAASLAGVAVTIGVALHQFRYRRFR